MLKNSEKFILAAARLKQTGGGDFNAFLTALEALTDDATDVCVQSPPDRILTAAGYARSHKTLCNILKECTAVAAKIEESQKNARAATTSGSP